MSFSFPGGINSYIARASGPTTTTNMTHCMWIKRTSNFTGRGMVGTIRTTTEDNGHQMFVNDPGLASAYGHLCLTNYGGYLETTSVSPLNTWQFYVLQGSSGNWSVKVFGGIVYETATLAQTAFAVGHLRWGGDSYGGDPNFVGIMAYLRTWNAVLTEAELNTERGSATAVRTSNLLYAHSGQGGALATALTGQTGGAYTSGSAVTYSSDAPTFSSANAMFISGGADMPTSTTPVNPGGGGTVIQAGTRYNRILSSDTFAAPWSTSGYTVTPTPSLTPPPGYAASPSVITWTAQSGISQLMSNLPQTRSTLSIAVRKVSTNANFLVLRHNEGSYASGAQGFFNLNTGVWDQTSNFGSVTESVFGKRSLGNNWWLCWISTTISGNRAVEFYPATTLGSQVPAVNESIAVPGLQYEDAVEADIATYHKITTTSITTRTLSTITGTLSSSSVGVGQQVTFTIALKDNTGAPWDQYGPVTLTYNSTYLTIGSVSQMLSDTAGNIVITVTGKALGTSTISATTGSLSTTPASLTVGSATALYVDIRAESGWEGTSGWNIGVYQKHPTERFPTVKLFWGSGQTFLGSLFEGASRMLVAVPGGVSVTAGQTVEVVIENDSFNGRPVDGPGIFEAIVTTQSPVSVSAPANSVLPTVGGTPAVGSIMTSTTGTWSNVPQGYFYEWSYSLNGTTHAGTLANGALSTYTVTQTDVGRYIRVAVAAWNSTASGPWAYSGWSAKVVAPPVNTVVPTVSGSYLVGATMTANPGTWTNSPTVYSYTWEYSTDINAITGTAIPGATSSTYVISGTYIGSYLRVRVSAYNGVNGSGVYSVWNLVS